MQAHLFIPDELKRWTPSRPQSRWCHWCCARHETKTMRKVLEGPMTWHFCGEQCAETWSRERHNEAKALLRLPAGERAKIRTEDKDAICKKNCGHSYARLRSLCDGHVPLP